MYATVERHLSPKYRGRKYGENLLSTKRGRSANRPDVIYHGSSQPYDNGGGMRHDRWYLRRFTRGTYDTTVHMTRIFVYYNREGSRARTVRTLEESRGRRQGAWKRVKLSRETARNPRHNHERRGERERERERFAFATNFPFDRRRVACEVTGSRSPATTTTTAATMTTRSQKSRRDRSVAANIFASRAARIDIYDSSRPGTVSRDASARRALAPRSRGPFPR